MSELNRLALEDKDAKIRELEQHPKNWESEVLALNEKNRRAWDTVNEVTANHDKLAERLETVRAEHADQVNRLHKKIAALEEDLGEASEKVLDLQKQRETRDWNAEQEREQHEIVAASWRERVKEFESQQHAYELAAKLEDAVRQRDALTERVANFLTLLNDMQALMEVVV